MFYESYTYSYTAGKDGRPALELLTGDTIDISEWLEFDFYDLVWFCNNHSDETKPMVGQCLGVSHRVRVALCYWILSEKPKFLSRTNIQNLTADKSRDTNIQERVFDYNRFM